MSDGYQNTLETLRRRVLRLHKALIGAERRRYEEIHGRIENEYQLLGLVSNDPEFAWLRPLTHYILDLEERLDAKEEAIELADVERFGLSLRALMTNSDSSPQFNFRYIAHLQNEPELVLLHGEIITTLPKPPPEGR